MPEKPLEHNDIVDLLGKLRDETPDYPAHLVAARKESFLKQVLDLSVSGSGQDKGGGQDGGDQGPKGGSGGPGRSGGPGKSGKPSKPGASGSSGGSIRPGGSSGSGGSGGLGGTLHKGSTGLGLGISLKSVFAFGAIVLLLTATYLFREQIAEVLAENSIIRVQETAEPLLVSSAGGRVTETPSANTVPDVGTPPSGLAGTGSTAGSASDGVENNNSGIPITGSDDVVIATPTREVSQSPANPTPKPPDNSIAGRLRYLLCVLQRDAASCE